MEVRQKLELILAGPGWTQAKVAETLGVSQSTINRWLRGTEPEGHHRDALAELHAKTFGYTKEKGMMQITGHVQQGGLVSFLQDAERDWTEMPPEDGEPPQALLIMTDTMMPEYEKGSVVYFSHRTDPENVVDTRCAVSLSDGRLLVRTIRYSSQNGRFTLSSSGAADIPNVRIEWAAPITWVKAPVVYVHF